MKTIKISLLLLILSISISCEKEEEPIPLAQNLQNGFWEWEDPIESQGLKFDSRIVNSYYICHSSNNCGDYAPCMLAPSDEPYTFEGNTITLTLSGDTHTIKIEGDVLTVDNDKIYQRKAELGYPDCP